MYLNDFQKVRVDSMLYLHDVWVNWFEGEENGYNVCHYHEWRKEDAIEILDQVPLLYITEELFAHIENDLDDLPSGLLEKICRRAYIRKGQERSILEYTAVVTNGKEILAFDTMGYRMPIRKSRLVPRQEQLVYSMIEKAGQESFGYVMDPGKKQYHILSMAPELVRGLTRKERQLKHLLMISLDQLKNANHLGELRYWMTEWDPKSYSEVRHMNEAEVWEALYQGVKHGWSKQQEELCEKMVKGQAFLEKMWKMEQSEEENSMK